MTNSNFSSASGLSRLAYFISERWQIYQRKEAGQPKPWTNDPILQQYRFCNVHRENDTVTKWIKEHWRDPNQTDPYLWHAMMIARMINWPESLQDMGYPEPWSQMRGRVARRALQDRKRRGEKVFTGAYIVSTNGNKMDKLEYVLSLFDLAWEQRNEIRPLDTDTLAEAHARLMKADGLGSFMAAQLIADLKHTPVLWQASDWWDWCAIGPGSRRGLNLMLGWCPTTPWRADAFIQELKRTRERLKLLLPKDMPLFCLQDLQNCFCEFGKWERTRLGRGKPRSSYPGRR